MAVKRGGDRIYSVVKSEGSSKVRPIGAGGRGPRAIQLGVPWDRVAPHRDKAVGENADVQDWGVNVGGLIKLFGRANVDEFNEA